MDKSISIQTVKRLPAYLSFLRSLENPCENNISAKGIAEALSLGEIQVRKDLASVSDAGKPKVGYRIAKLIDDIENYLGYRDSSEAVLVGAGKLGRALIGYRGFEAYGLDIVAAFDCNATPEQVEGKTPVFPMEKLPDLISRMNVRIGIITVPAESAQEVCDLMVTNGVLAIWNFAPVHLTAPEGILIRSENMAASLAVLRKHLKNELT